MWARFDHWTLLLDDVDGAIADGSELRRGDQAGEAPGARGPREVLVFVGREAGEGPTITLCHGEGDRAGAEAATGHRGAGIARTGGRSPTWSATR